MAHFNTVNRWLREVREAANTLERLQDDLHRAGVNSQHLELARQELLLALEELKQGGAEGLV